MSRSMRPVPAAVLACCLTGCLASASAGSGAWAGAAPSAGEPDAARPHGIFSHGDSSGFMEDFYGDRVERAPSDAAATGGRKHDPAVNWDDRRVRR